MNLKPCIENFGQTAADGNTIRSTTDSL